MAYFYGGFYILRTIKNRAEAGVIFQVFSEKGENNGTAWSLNRWCHFLISY
jgi:hypothetical protein